MKAYVHTKTCTQMFLAALFTIAIAMKISNIIFDFFKPLNQCQKAFPAVFLLNEKT